MSRRVFFALLRMFYQTVTVRTVGTKRVIVNSQQKGFDTKKNTKVAMLSRGDRPANISA